VPIYPVGYYVLGGESTCYGALMEDGSSLAVLIVFFITKHK
jgi:hypothetical protein